jgi:peptidoglycan hydrolase CwlO-like protein
MIAFLKRVPWWAWAVVLIVIVLIWQNLTGWAAARQVYTQALDNLRADQTRVVEALQENQKMYEAEIVRLQSEKERLQKEKVAIQKQAIESAVEVSRLKGKIGELQTQLQNIIVSDNPDLILDDLRRMGISSVRRKP